MMKNEVIEAIMNRRSCKSYLPDAVPQEIIDQVIEAGLYAANGRGMQSPVIVEVTDKALRDKIEALNSTYLPKGGTPFYGAPAVIIDMGTATTMTVVDKNKSFIGGVILPGVAIALQSLESGTAQLPHIQLKAPQKAIQTDTIECMQAGVVYGNAGAMDALIDRMFAELGYEATVIASGGLAPLIVPHCRHRIIIDDELLLKGLDILFYKNTK